MYKQSMQTAWLGALGLLWIAAGLLLRSHSGVRLPLFIASASLLMSVAGVIPAGPYHQSERMTRMLSATTIIRSVCVLTATAILLLLSLPEYIGASLAVLFGLHLLPFTALNGSLGDKVVSASMVVWSAVCVLLLRGENLVEVSVLGAGCIMVGGALYARRPASLR